MPSEAVAANLAAAKRAIDTVFGAGHAARHPELVAAFLQAAALEGAVQSGRATAGEVMLLAARLSREINETLLKLKPRFFG